jgi:hypothetical protein
MQSVEEAKDRAWGQFHSQEAGRGQGDGRPREKRNQFTRNDQARHTSSDARLVLIGLSYEGPAGWRGAEMERLKEGMCMRV